MADWKMVNFDSSVLEGHIKFRDKKKWKRRWCVLRRLSPVANSLTMQLYKKISNKSQLEFQAKASFNLEQLLGIETCFLLGKESQTLAVICKSMTCILAFEKRETLLEWHALISEILGQSDKFEVQLLSFPPKFEVSSGIATLHIRDWHFSLVQGIPPRLLGYWNLADLRRFGAFDERRFCFEGGSRCSFKGGEGVFVLGSNKSREIAAKFELAVRGRLSESHRIRSNPTSPPTSGLLTPLMRHRLSFSSRPTQSMSKPCTPLLSNHRKAAELCLSPPCSRHFRSASQQHSRHSSFSSGTNCQLGRNSTLQQSDPEMLYDKPRSLNVTMTNATLESAVEPGGPPRPGSAAPSNHYDTPRSVLKRSLMPETSQYQETRARSSVDEVEKKPTSAGLTAEELSALYATVVKPKRQASNESQSDGASNEDASKFRRNLEVEGYLMMQRTKSQWPDYVEMQPLPCSPASLLKQSGRHPDAMVETDIAIPGATTISAYYASNNGSKAWDEYPNSKTWFQSQRMTMEPDVARDIKCERASGHHSNLMAYQGTYQNPNSLVRCLHPKACHGTLPLVRASPLDAVHLRLRRSASMPCRQGNRDSSDSTDSGVSVTADSGAQLPSVVVTSGHPHHLLCRHWSLPRPNHALPSNKANKGNRLQPWPNTPLCNSGPDGAARSRDQYTKGPNLSLTSRSQSGSNDSNISQILDQLETLSVASTGYETCV